MNRSPYSHWISIGSALQLWMLLACWYSHLLFWLISVKFDFMFRSFTLALRTRCFWLRRSFLLFFLCSKRCRYLNFSTSFIFNPQTPHKGRANQVLLFFCCQWLCLPCEARCVASEEVPCHWSFLIIDHEWRTCFWSCPFGRCCARARTLRWFWSCLSSLLSGLTKAENCNVYDARKIEWPSPRIHRLQIRSVLLFFLVLCTWHVDPICLIFMKADQSFTPCLPVDGEFHLEDGQSYCVFMSGVLGYYCRDTVCLVSYA